MNWLLFNTEFPWPLTHGTYLRVYHLARALAAGGDEVALLADGDDSTGRAEYEQAGVRVLPPPADRTVLPHRPQYPRSPYTFRPGLAGALATVAGNFDAVLLFRAEAMQYASEAAAAKAVVAELVDDPVLEHRRRLWREFHPRLTPWRLKFLALCPRYERAFLPAITLTTFVSQADADSFRRRHPAAAVRAIPNGVEVEHFARPDDRPQPAGPPTFVFLGNLTHKPNEDAARFLLRKIAPLIRRQRSDARFVIVGDNPSPALRALAGDGVTVTGFVPDVRPYLWDATAVLLPMRMGTGIKNKLLEAWAAGAAVAATPLACQGVPAIDGENLLIARSAGELACAAIRIARDARLQQSLGHRGRQTILEHHTWPASASQLGEAVSKGLRR